MDEIKALMLLKKCTGDEIWSIETCQQEGIPEAWVEELRDTFESGFDMDRNTIYIDEGVTNQYHGVLDLHLACKLTEFLGVDWRAVTEFELGRPAMVRALQEAVEEG